MNLVAPGSLLAKARERYQRLPPSLKRVIRPLRLVLDRDFRRRERHNSRTFSAFAGRYGAGLQPELAAPSRGNALVVCSCTLEDIPLELFLIQGLKAAGFRPVVLADPDPWKIRYYRLAGVEHFFFWNEVLGAVDLSRARQVVREAGSARNLLGFQHAGARVGKYAISTSLRALRVGSLDLDSALEREAVAARLASSMAHAEGAFAVVDRLRPCLALSVDPGYTPRGEVYDACCAADIPTITWNIGHTSRAISLKRFTRRNRDDHPLSLSPQSWIRLQTLPWTQTRQRRLHQELSSAYAKGDWFSQAGTQFNTRMLEANDIAQRLGLDPRRKTAVIFPHILWDATLFWGTDLFANYEEWLVATVQAAWSNECVNWIIKVHPANSVKNARDGISSQPAEMLAIEKRLGPLPPHIVLIPHTTDINTYSLYPLMDYAVTVRGTVGIEAAIFGVPVLTAGTGRYDRKGFTIDSSSSAEYLDRLGHIEDIPRPTSQQVELAQRFAYGLFVMRSLCLDTIRCEFQKDAKASLHLELRAFTRDDWLKASDVGAFARWLCEEHSEDFLHDPEADSRTSLAG